MPTTNVAALGPVHYTWGGKTQLADLIDEVDEYFQMGVRLEPGSVVVDAGANIGVFALHAASRCAGLRFFCFEPIPELYRVLEKNFENPLLSGREHHLFNLGLTRLGGPESLSFSYFKRLPCDTTQNIEEKRHEFDRFFDSKADKLRDVVAGAVPVAGGALGAALAFPVRNLLRTTPTQWLFERAIGRQVLECKLIPLETVIRRHGVERIDLLKVDVEGAELEVLKGLGEDGWARVSQVVLEGHDESGRLREITELLNGAGLTDLRVEVPPLAIERGLNNFVLYARRPSPN